MTETKHVCPLCDYIYEDSKGDENTGISPGTKFSELPEDFKHPNCAATPDMFESCTCVNVE